MKKYIKILIALSIVLTACKHIQQSRDDNGTQPILKEQPKLIYPFTAQQNNWRGTSTIIFSISKEGNVTQIRIHESSGVKELDNAAENYCKGLVFIPANVNGEAIASNMKWDVKFDLKDFDKKIKIKIAEVNELYSDIEELEGAARQSVQNEILKSHNDMISETQDGLRFNEYSYGVIQKSLGAEWKSLNDSYPITFLLYHDFITRFGDYDSLSEVQSRLEHALKQDLNHLRVSTNIGDENKTNGAMLIQKIKRFVEENYPELKLDDLDLEVNLNNSLS